MNYMRQRELTWQADTHDCQDDQAIKISGNQLSRKMINPVDNAPDKAVNCHLSIVWVLLSSMPFDLNNIVKSS